ncbi:uncharacterized protein KY384_006655 [Bacidia gigantensis]|uniref:uncharacterized protein n=1 Tax=Bacidia gigantensis TaxID=2732470 RepID=UPI001D059847|nr:uncharacterized protein KY384_006655 [Bacidia gigantensis]KAG8528966.1 hypothetical protein KY384_006655 [Bacidia gigantensis]
MTSTSNTSWSQLQWRRRLETFGANDASVLASGPRGEIDGICNMGELTDKGRETTLALGERFRRLYVDQLGFMPTMIGDADMFYLRASPLPRALESVQQSFVGMYPLGARAAGMPPPTIVTRTVQDETIFPNDNACKRYGQLMNAFWNRAAERWNGSEDLKYLTGKIGKWMPEGEGKEVRVDGHPRLSGIMDTVNSTLAHGEEVRLPKEFYDARARDIVDRIGCEEWFAGFKESHEYRLLGIGPLAGDIVTRMVGSVERSGSDGLLEVGGKDGEMGVGRGGERSLKFGLSGCHDTTLAALLASVGAFDNEKWPPYTSHVAFELFRDVGKASEGSKMDIPVKATKPGDQMESKGGFFSSLFGRKKLTTEGIARKPTAEMTIAEKERLKGYFVRIRYNDRPVTIPGCRPQGNHLDGDETFCTLEAFKSIVDKFTPRSWKESCLMNLDQPPIPQEVEPAG